MGLLMLEMMNLWCLLYYDVYSSSKGTRIPIVLLSHITKQKSLEMSIIEMWVIDGALVIELHDDITVKETGLNCAFVLSEFLCYWVPD